jgi:tRNA(Ile)-lysidine synthase
MISDFSKYISDNNLARPTDRILLAVSGGIDSMVMANLFHLLNYKTGIAHCNFMLRGEESEKDEEVVRQFSAENSIAFFTIRFDTKSFASKNKLSIQMAARELRYNWFEQIRKENGYDSIAVAHNLNDNIETVLINLTRGTGIAGMTGMRPLSGKIIRPLLFATRKKISDFQIQHNIIFREDRSNSDTKYVRNKIRHLVIPVLKEINPAIENTLNDTAERFAGFYDIVSDYISGIRAEVAIERAQHVSFLLDKLRPLSKAILFELFKPYGITDALTIDLIRIIEGESGGMVITPTHRIIKNRDELIVSEEKEKDETVYIINNIDDFTLCPRIGSAEQISISKGYKIPSLSNVACLDLRLISYPLVIRKWKEGDYFHPLGMNQKKKLSDYFIDKKYSIIDKENILILESDNKIVWIIGERIDDRFKITSVTKEVLLLVAGCELLVAGC